VVLLGETHGRAENHRWQLHTVAALHGRRPDLAIGLEMLPRRAQPVLDRWVEGALSVADFLEQTDWGRVWGVDPGLYLPILHFARQNRVPLVALNVDRALIRRVGREGWAAVPEAARQGVGEAAPPAEAYIDMLAAVYVIKQRLADGASEDMLIAEVSEDERRRVRGEEAFAHFVDAQLAWDRAMAEAIAAARADLRDGDGPPLVVALVGRAHAEHGHGVARQLADLGVFDTAALLAVDALCEGPEPGLAEAVFVTGGWRDTAPAGPRLGVMIETAENGVLVREVIGDSVADATGIAGGDVIFEAAGVPLAGTAELIAIVRRQAPGTWLPLVVRRAGCRLELVAKFPTSFR
jgi:uncharacterized iron-regulated protein